MMDVKSSPGNTKVFLKVSQVGKLTEKGIRHGFFSLGKDLKDTANTAVLKRPKKGRTYIIRGPSGRKRRHVASAPGESHANITGKARKSIGWKVQGAKSMDFGYGAASSDTPPEWVGFLEKGTRRMRARPTLRNSVDDNIRNADVHFIKQIGRRFAL